MLQDAPRRAVGWRSFYACAGLLRAAPAIASNLRWNPGLGRATRQNLRDLAVKAALNAASAALNAR